MSVPTVGELSFPVVNSVVNFARFTLLVDDNAWQHLGLAAPIVDM